MKSNGLILELTKKMKMVKRSNNYYTKKLLKLNKMKNIIENKNYRNKRERLKEINKEIIEKEKKVNENEEADYHLENLIGILLHRERNKMKKNEYYKYNKYNESN